MPRPEHEEVVAMENEEREDVSAHAAVPEVEQDDERDVDPDVDPDVEAHSKAC